MNNYRPISITSVICKLMESIIRNYMVEHMTSNDYLSKGQLLHLVDEWTEYIDSGGQIVFMAYIFIVKYSVLFGLFNFGLGFGLLNLASASRLWPRPRPQPRGSGLDLDLGLKCLASSLASFNISAFTLILKRLLIRFLRKSLSVNSGAIIYIQTLSNG